jgi:hypothetical protein
MEWAIGWMPAGPTGGTTMKRALLTLLLLSATDASSLVGQDDNETSRKTLAGLNGVFVAVTQVSEDARRSGLSETQLQTDVELKLRQAGIPVLTEGDASRTPGVPYLYVTVNTLQLSSGGVAGVVRIRR